MVSGGLRPPGSRRLTPEENPPEGDDSLESTEPCLCADAFAHTNSSFVGNVLAMPQSLLLNHFPLLQDFRRQMACFKNTES